MKRLLVLGAILAAGATPAFDAQAEIGVLAAVNRDMTGARPAEQARPIFINERLVQNEEIATTANGGGQVLFLDQTSLTIAPNSSIVLDEYVYDPATDSGAIGLTVTRGALRLIGGRVTKTAEAVIKTPTATIGIRGGIGSTTVAPDGSTRYIHLAGIASRIRTAQGELTITREGGYAEIGLDGLFEYLGVAPPDVMAAAVRSSAGSGDGGSVGGGDASGQIGAVESEVSGADGAVENAPISTTGERESVDFGETTTDLGELPNDEFADANLMEELADELTMDLDGIAFAGNYAVTSATTMGTLVQDLPFSLVFSLSGNQGLATIGLPDTMETFTATTQGPDGTEFIADSFIVIGDGDQIINEPGLPTVLLGDVLATFTTNASEQLSGNVSVNYEQGTLFENLLFADGVVTDLPGQPVPTQGLNEGIDDLRNVFVTEPGQ